MLRFVAGLVVVASLSGGCMFFTTKKEGAQLREEMMQLREDFADQREALDVQLQRAKVEMEKLEKILAEGTQLLARNDADVGAQVEKIQELVNALTGQIEEARHEMEVLRKELADDRARVDAQLAAQPKPTSTPTPVNGDLFAAAERRFAEKQYDGVRKTLREFLKQHGTDPRADNARFLVGESYFAQGRYAAAIGEYQRVIDGYPKGDAVDDAFLRNGIALYKLKSCSDARVFLREMLRRFPSSPLAAEAKKTLNEIDKVRNKKSKCAG